LLGRRARNLSVDQACQRDLFLMGKEMEAMFFGTKLVVPCLAQKRNADLFPAVQAVHRRGETPSSPS
jgi:hypothetical protein